MKTFRSSRGPFAEQPYFSINEIDRICTDALAETGHLPVEPGKVRIDRFIEKRFGVPIIFEPLPETVLGFTEFGRNGVAAVHVSVPKGGIASGAEERRVNSTLAHEAGHGLLHSHLFSAEFGQTQLFANDPDVETAKILCRDGDAAPRRATKRAYDGRWWEFQANQAIGSLLMPKELFLLSMAPLLEKLGPFGLEKLRDARRNEAIGVIAEIFDVNPAAARLRLDHFFPPNTNQLTF